MNAPQQAMNAPQQASREDDDVNGSEHHDALDLSSSVVRCGTRIHNAVPIKEGFLVKQAVRGHGFAEQFVVSKLGIRRWHTHYVKVFPEKLLYFQMQGDERPKATIKLESLTTSVRISRRRPNCLVVDFMREEWGPCALYMQASNEKLRDEWVEAIRMCIPKVDLFENAEEPSKVRKKSEHHRSKSEKLGTESELIPSSVVMQLSKLHDKLLVLAEEKRLANNTLDSKEAEFSRLREENGILKDELAAWWNWTNSQKEGFAQEVEQISEIEHKLQQNISSLLSENSRLRENAEKKNGTGSRKKSSRLNLEEPETPEQNKSPRADH